MGDYSQTDNFPSVRSIRNEKQAGDTIVSPVCFSYQFFLSESSESKIDCRTVCDYNKSIQETEDDLMKVLAISSSPRKGGNSDVLCDEFLKGAAESGHETVKIRLAEKKIAPCMACYGCAESHVCVRKDDMSMVLEALKAADVIVLASPVYFYSICAQMKMMIDRCLADYQAIKNKTFYLIVTAADPQHTAAEETLADFRGYLRCLPGAKEAGVVFGTGTWDKGDVYRHPSLKQAYEMGRSI